MSLTRGDLTTDPTDAERLLREHNEQPYTQTFGDVGERAQFLEEHKLPRLIQPEVDHLNSPVNVKDIDFKILKLQRKKALVLMVLLENSAKHWKNLTQPLPEAVPVHLRKLVLPRRPNKTRQRVIRELRTSIPREYRCENP